MSNGCCLCCTARTDLIDILHSLLERAEKFDRILIETSGMADPNPVAQTFFVDEEISSRFALDAIVTLVDAKHVDAHLDEVNHNGVGTQAADQIAFADRIVVNKVDLVTEQQLGRLEQRIRGINATAEIITSSYSAVDLEQILGIGAFDLTRTVAADPAWLDDSKHVHEPSLTSVGIELDGDLDGAALQGWLTGYVESHGDDLYRLKGVLAVDGDDRRFVLQGIHRMFDLAPSAPWGRDRRTSKIVFIGRDLDRTELTRALQSCRSPELELSR